MTQPLTGGISEALNPHMSPGSSSIPQQNTQHMHSHSHKQGHRQQGCQRPYLQRQQQQPQPTQAARSMKGRPVALPRLAPNSNSRSRQAPAGCCTSDGAVWAPLRWSSARPLSPLSPRARSPSTGHGQYLHNSPLVLHTPHFSAALYPHLSSGAGHRSHLSTARYPLCSIALCPRLATVLGQNSRLSAALYQHLPFWSAITPPGMVPVPSPDVCCSVLSCT